METLERNKDGLGEGEKKGSLALAPRQETWGSRRGRNTLSLLSIARMAVAEMLSHARMERVPEPAVDVEPYDSEGTASLLGAYHFNALAVSSLAPQGARVLELGCGSGRFASFLAHRRADLTITGVDVDEAMLERARETIRLEGLDDRVQFERADMARFIETLGRDFDVVVSLFSLHHLADSESLRRCLQEVGLLTREGARLWIFDHARPRSPATAGAFPLAFTPFANPAFQKGSSDSLMASWSFPELSQEIGIWVSPKVESSLSRVLPLYQVHSLGQMRPSRLWREPVGFPRTAQQDARGFAWLFPSVSEGIPVPSQRGEVATALSLLSARLVRRPVRDWLRLQWSRVKTFAQLAFEGLFLRRKTREVYQLIGGHIFFQTVRAAVELGIFEHLDRQPGMTKDELMESLRLEEQPLRILLLGLTSLGLVKKTRGGFRNTFVTKLCFLSKSPKSLTEIVRWQAEINYSAMPYFLDSLKAGTNVGLKVFRGEEPTLYERLGHQPKLASIFQRAMEQISRQANGHLREGLDLRSTSFLVDVGGGEGENVVQLTNRWCHLRAGVLDLPHIGAETKKRFDALPQRARLEAFSGNCFEEEFPKGPDAYLFCHFLTIWSKEENVALLQKAHRALPENGKVFIFNQMQRNDESGPMSAAMGSPYFLCLATGKGMLYTWREYVDMLRRAGFRNVRLQRLPQQHGLITGVK